MLKTLLFLAVLTLPQLKESAKNAFDEAEKKVLNKVVVPNVIQKCPCDGKGFIVHGDGHRTPCPGFNEQPCKFRTGDFGEQAPSEHGVIYFYSRSDDSCIYCEKWEKQILPLCLKAGWKVIKKIDDINAVPYYDIKLGGKVGRVKGFLTTERLNLMNEQYRKGEKWTN